MLTQRITSPLFRLPKLYQLAPSLIQGQLQFVLSSRTDKLTDCSAGSSRAFGTMASTTNLSTYKLNREHERNNLY
jgi:hypothetical protein